MWRYYETVKALRKDVTTKCHVGKDCKRKLLENRKGKKRRRQVEM
jgi:translation elongation factor EF-4